MEKGIYNASAQDKPRTSLRRTHYLADDFSCNRTDYLCGIAG